MDLLRSLPLGLYLEQPVTWLHRLDSRVKLVWLMSFLAAPVLANSVFRIVLVILLIVLTFTARIPLRVWRQQMGWLLMLSFFVFLLTMIAPDGLQADHQPRRAADEFVQAPATRNQAGEQGRGGEGEKSSILNPKSQIQNLKTQDYRYVLFERGAIKVTRRSLALAISVSTLLFTLIYSTNLFLLTTAPEEITAGLESMMRPLRAFNWPVTEIALTLTLSLRFIPLVLEEVQNLVRSIYTRAINWKKLGLRRSIQVWLLVAERLLENLLLRAEQIASAMQVRGFTSPNQHRVQWHQLRLRGRDWLALTSLVLLWGTRLIWGWET